MTRDAGTSQGGAIGDSPFERAWRRAVRLLAASEKTTAELRSRLIRAGFEKDVVGAVLRDLTERRWLNDRSVARASAEREVARLPATRAFVEAKLEFRGIEGASARRAAKEALRDHDESADARELAARIARRAGVRGAALRRRILAALARRGFDEATALDAAESVVPSTSDSYDETGGLHA